MKYSEGNYYHIYNRGALKNPIFFEQENFRFLVRLLKHFSSQYSVTLVAYCLMPNHYHLLLRLEQSGNMGQYLRSVFTSFTQSMNHRFGFNGTLFQGQCKAKHVPNDLYCGHLVRYIHRNPVEAKLVKESDLWEFSDFAEWTQESSNDFPGRSLRDALFKNGVEYRRYVQEYTKGDNEVAKEFLFDEK